MNYGMNLRTLLEGWLEDIPDVVISGITQNPAHVRPGCAFVVSGIEPAVGMRAVGEALDRGCAVIIHDGMGGLPHADIHGALVPGLADRLGEMASRFWAAPSDLMTVTAITGAFDRAVVSGFLAQVWQRSCVTGGAIWRRGASPAEALQPSGRRAPDVFSLNETLAACVDNGIDQVAVEVSPEALKQGRCQTLQIDLAMITSLSPHVDGEHAERRLLTEFAPRFAVVNIDDPIGRSWSREFSDATEMLGIGFDPRADLSVRVVSMDQDGMALEFVGPWGKANIRSEMSGRDSALNLLLTVAGLTLLGMDWYEACRQVELLRPVSRSLAMTEERGMRVALERAA